MPDHRPKNFTYWRADFENPSPSFPTLQDFMTSAFEETVIEDRIIWDRDRDIDKDDGLYAHFINYKTMEEEGNKDFFCANLFGYEKGRRGEVIIEDQFDKEELDPTELDLGDTDGRSRQILDGKLYFICHKDHLIAAQDRRITVNQLEKYLIEIFHKRCVEFNTSCEMKILRSIPRSQHQALTETKKINLFAPIGHKAVAADEGVQQSFSGSTAIDVIRTLTGSAFFDNFTDRRTALENLLHEENVELVVSIRWNRKKSERLLETFDTVANVLRHIEDDVLGIEILTRLGTLKSNDFRIGTTGSVEYINGSPNNADIFAKMIKWYFALESAQEI